MSWTKRLGQMSWTNVLDKRLGQTSWTNVLDKRLGQTFGQMSWSMASGSQLQVAKLAQTPVKAHLAEQPSLESGCNVAKVTDWNLKLVPQPNLMKSVTKLKKPVFWSF